MAIYFDIETAPLESQKLNALMPVFKARANIKDPEKIEADIREKIAEFIANAALGASTGRVLAVGFARRNEGDVEFIEGEEEQILSNFWRLITDERGVILEDVIGFNSNSFDVPFLIRRSFILGVKIPATATSIWRNKTYLNSSFKDVMDVWACGTREMVSLDHLSKALGIGSKNGDGALFYKLYAQDRPAALEYLKNDVELTRACALRLGMAKWM